MTESNTKVALPLPVKPTTDAWGRIKQVFNNLYQDESFRPDHVLTEKIRHALEADDLLRKTDLAHLAVTLHEGVATISGHVVRALNKARAEELARAVPGVSNVVNQLVVDEELMIIVAQALGLDPRTRGEQIQVNVQHGVIYLGGSVAQAAVRLAAGAVAASISLARGIVNVIRTPGRVLDKDEERFVQPRIDSEIYATDGQVGHVDQVIINPHNRRVTAVVVTGHHVVPQELANPPAQRHTLIPMQGVRLAPSGALFLNVNDATVAHFADFNPLCFVAPPIDWQPPYPYGWVDVQFDSEADDLG